MRIFALPAAFLFLFFLPFLSSAQTPSHFSQNFSIELRPENPKPGETVIATVNDFSLGISGATIKWQLDGEEVPDSTNKRSIEFTAGSLGDTMNLSVLLLPQGGIPLSTTREITPSAIDIIVEPHTYIPDFYLGRGLPSLNSSVSLTAIVHSDKKASELSYVWRLNNKTLGGGSITNNNKMDTVVPLGRQMVVSVEAIDRSGAIVAKSAFSLPIVQPEIYFYEVNALKGLVRLPIQDKLTMIGSETTLQAVPYNLGTDMLNSRPLLEWELNGVLQETNFANPLRISIVNDGFSQGESNLGLHIRNLENLMEGVQGSLRIQF